MKNQNCNIITVTIYVLFGIIVFWGIYHIYHTTKKELINYTQLIFHQAVNKEEENTLNKYFLYNATNRKLSDSIVIETSAGKKIFRKPFNKDSITPIENQKWRIQYILFNINSNHISTLDSTFQASLPFSAQTNISCTQIAWNGDTIKNNTNKLSNKAIILNPIIFEWNKIPETRIQIEASIEYPQFYILWKALQKHIIAILIVLIIFFIITRRYILYRNKVNRSKIIKPLTPAPTEYIQLTANILFSKTLGEIKHNDKSIRLTATSLRLFMALLDAPEHCLSYVEISTCVLKRPKRQRKEIDSIYHTEQKIDYVDHGDINAIHQSIKYLRDKIVELPIIIQHIKPNKFQLIIQSSLMKAYKTKNEDET